MPNVDSGLPIVYSKPMTLKCGGHFSKYNANTSTMDCLCGMTGLPWQT